MPNAKGGSPDVKGKNGPQSNAGPSIGDLGLSPETIASLRETSSKENVSVDALVKSLLKEKGKSNANESSSKQSKGNNYAARNMEMQFDFSKIAPFASSEIVDILRRIANSVENIERHHEQGWSDQRIDLNAISKRLDKLM